MAQVMVNLKKRMEHACAEMGLSMTTAFTIFARKVANEQRIPFEVSVDHFYSQSNMEYLKKVITDIEEGRAVLVERDLLED